MENVWAVIIILLVILIIIVLIYIWHNNDSNNTKQSFRLTCNNVVKVINLDTISYDLHFMQGDNVLNQTTLPNSGEISICRPEGEYNLVVSSNNEPKVILEHKSLESSYLILARGHFYLTDNISKGHNGKLSIYNDTNSAVCVDMVNEKSVLHATVDARGFLECESEYYHQFTDDRQNFTIDVMSIDDEKHISQQSVNGRSQFILRINDNNVEIV